MFFFAVRLFLFTVGVFQSVFYQMPSGEVDVFADGGLLVNYPIFAFDGEVIIIIIIITIIIIIIITIIIIIIIIIIIFNLTSTTVITTTVKDLRATCRNFLPKLTKKKKKKKSTLKKLFYFF